MEYLNNLAKEIYDTAASKGWHDKPVAFGDAIANIHGELTEAWEEYRHGRKFDEIYFTISEESITPNEGWQDDIKPEGIPTEFADVIIRVLDACHMYGIDIDAAVAQKMKYNNTRTFRHGGKII